MNIQQFKTDITKLQEEFKNSDDRIKIAEIIYGDVKYKDGNPRKPEPSWNIRAMGKDDKNVKYTNQPVLESEIEAIDESKKETYYRKYMDYQKQIIDALNKGE